MPATEHAYLKALGSGAAGAAAVTMLNETARLVVPGAPRLDILGMHALAKTIKATGTKPPRRTILRGLALGGDLAANALYYSLVAAGSRSGTWWRGALLGLGAGIGAVVLPPVLRLSSETTSRSVPTVLMSVGWYLAGGLAAAGLSRLLDRAD